MRQLAVGFMGSLLLFGFACGGKVVVESTNSTGAGGTGAGGGGVGGDITSTGDVSPVGVVSSSTGGASLCQQFCADQASKGCNQGNDCVGSCQEAYASAGACTPQLDGLLQCLLATGETTCMDPVACAGQLEAYTSCVSPTTCGGSAECSVTSDGSCDCQTDCNGAKLEVQCSPGNGMDVCVCIKDGVPIDKCVQPQVDGLACDIVQGCCAKSFFN